MYSVISWNLDNMCSRELIIECKQLLSKERTLGQRHTAWKTGWGCTYFVSLWPILKIDHIFVTHRIHISESYFTYWYCDEFENLRKNIKINFSKDFAIQSPSEIHYNNIKIMNETIHIKDFQYYNEMYEILIRKGLPK